MSGCKFPNELTAGDSLAFTETAAGFPASDGWVISFRLVPQDPGAQAIELVGTPSGDSHEFTATSATTAGWVAGFYAWAKFATLAGDRTTLGRGSTTINPDPATAAPGFDGRSQNRIALDAINAVLAKRATLDQQRYRINNRELYRESIAELMKLQARYQALVNAEESKASGRSLFNRAVRVSF